VSLKVFNLLGEEIAALVEEELSTGVHNRSWEARLHQNHFGGQAAGFASGVYLYRIQAGKFMETRKLLLLR
jgi:hypothetical protein